MKHMPKPECYHHWHSQKFSRKSEGANHELSEQKVLFFFAFHNTTVPSLAQNPPIPCTHGYHQCLDLLGRIII